MKDLAFPDPGFQKPISSISAGITSLLTAGLVLAVRLAADLGYCETNIPPAGLRMVQPVHQPLHSGLHDHDCGRCTEVLHTAHKTRPHY